MKNISQQPVLWYKEATSPTKSRSILFVHGMWGWHWYWSNFINVFTSSGYDCYAIDLYGHGPSWGSPVRGNVSLDKYVDEIKASISIISENNTLPILIGHSMGGLIVQKIVEIVPVAGIVLIASAVSKGIIAIPTLRTVLIFLKYFMPAFFKRVIMPSDKELIYMVFHNVKGNELKTALEQYVPESGCAFFQIMTGSISVDYGSISCPVLVVGGSKDRTIKPETCKRLAQKLNAEIEIFNKNGHWLVREDGWQKICKSILEWIDQKDN